MTFGKRLFLIISTSFSGIFGLVAGYLIGVVTIGRMKAIPFIRIGGFELRGNWPGLLLGLILCAVCMISTYKSGQKKDLA